jgi:hypothetical protein
VFKLYLIIKQIIIKNIIIFNFLIRRTIKHNPKKSTSIIKKNGESTLYQVRKKGYIVPIHYRKRHSFINFFIFIRADVHILNYVRYLCASAREATRET